jgi:hypothetical protein
MSSPELPHGSATRLTPGDLVDRLEGVRRNVTVMAVLRGVGIVIAALCALLIGGALVDWMLRLPGTPRLIGLVAAVSVLAWLAYKHVWLPATRQPTLDEVAGHAEDRFPAFEDRLRSSLTFLGDGQALPSDPMRRTAVEEAGDVAGGVTWSDLVRRKPTATALGWAATAVATLVLLAMLVGPLTGTILGRLIDPLNPNHQWPKQFNVAAAELPPLHPAGRPMTVTATLSKGDPDDVRPMVLFRVGEDGPVRRVAMARGDDGVFTASIDPRLAENLGRERLSVWVEAGDDETTPEAVALVRRPVLESATLLVTPPPYAQGEERRVDLGDGTAVVGFGSDLELRLNYSKPLDAVEGFVVEEDVATLRWTADESRTFSVKATDLDGLSSDASPTMEVIVRPDAPPTVQIDDPRRNGTRTPEAVVPLEVTAEDDFGLVRADLVVERLAPVGGEGWTARVPLLEAASVDVERGRGESRRYKMAYDWDLSAVADQAGESLRPGDVLEFYVVAKDNFEIDGVGHEPVESGRLRITIISQEALNREVIRELQQLREQVESARRRQSAAKSEASAWAEATAQQDELDQADREAGERIANRQSREAAAVKRLAERALESADRLRENNSPSEDLVELSENVSEQLDDAAEGPMREASSKLNEAAKSDEASDREQAAGEARERQDEADEALADVMREMEAIGGLRQAADAMRRLLDEQQQLGEQADANAARNLGKRDDEISDEDRQEAERLAAEQEKLADEVDELLERMEEQAEAQEGEEQDPTAEAMEQAAQAGRQQDVSGQQRQAAQSQRQGEQQDAQQAREAAELGLEIMLRELQDAEREALRRLERRLAELRDQIERLVRLQSGHNADNLVIRGVEDEAVAELIEASGRDADQQVEPTTARLSAGQEQSEQNTRDLAAVADADANDGGRISELLNTAALRMERAAVELRDEDLAEAYEPPQVGALASLREALEAADEEQQRVQEELERQQREAVKQRLEAVRQTQTDVINATTAELAAVENPKRRDRLRPRAEVAPQQAELAIEMVDIAAALGEAGGVIFVYTAEEAVTLMRDSQTRLDALDVTPMTLATQGEIVVLLDDLIDSLRIDGGGNEQRFEQNEQPGGGGGGDQGPPLPPQAEIKLFRKLQQRLNEQTKQAHDLGDATQRLAERQGEYRDVLDEMLQKYSRGELKFGPEPNVDTLLPEEAAEDVDEALDDRELLDDLLGDAGREGELPEDGEPAEAGSPTVQRLGDYMARARQRLDVKQDAGPVTQAVQERILLELDALAEQSQQQQQQSSSSSSSGGNASGQQQPGGDARGVEQAPQPGDPQQGDAQQGEQAGQPQPGQPSQGENAQDGPEGIDADLSRELEETRAGWGQLTPRQRQAILDTQTDKTLDKYRRLTEEFYRKLSEKEDE